ncbi:uncharacterized protein PHACADRAFT_195715 [Phanerochaete carnosa HHB-10118-sp]|uniref:Enoyl reductase (ER) domain-containing protein n=1 Tax=Phanerochaete carnosa (strain HHB-10118-sp) TaxID=650164 RepID=K5W9M6_PHACS|nr:uncharacterized protein PHACADRAFT_195715 [Phanerochaete carnosa HHB-10118-sp]EKM55674.1 hypothetical protein PHACADRAFT_195715 [Phanerochaete carnosa HHB-10118-sp]
MSATKLNDAAIFHRQKAWVVVRRGKPRVALVLDENAAVPSDLAEGEVLIKVQAAALNPVGYKLMGILPNFIAKRPHVAEHDFTGIIADANGTDLATGQAVWGFVPVGLKIGTGQGSLVQYTRVPTSHIVLRSPSLKPSEAAGLGLVGLTACEALVHIGKLEEGQSLFINGGSTAVGIVAIQLAKAIGAKVTVTGSSKREEFLRSLGVDAFVDYTKAPVYEQLERDPPTPKFHLIFDAVGDANVPLYTQSPAYLQPNGLYLAVAPWPTSTLGSIMNFAWLTWEVNRPLWLGGTPRQWRKLPVMTVKKEKLEELARYVDEGKVKPIVDSVFKFEDALAAYDRIMSQRALGKVVVKVDPEVD